MFFADGAYFRPSALVLITQPKKIQVSILKAADSMLLKNYLVSQIPPF